LGESVLDAGFDSVTPLLWLLEGFPFHLFQKSLNRSIEAVSGLAVKGSWLFTAQKQAC